MSYQIRTFDASNIDDLAAAKRDRLRIVQVFDQFGDWVPADDFTINLDLLDAGRYRELVGDDTNNQDGTPSKRHGVWREQI